MKNQCFKKINCNECDPADYTIVGNSDNNNINSIKYKRTANSEIMTIKIFWKFSNDSELKYIGHFKMNQQGLVDNELAYFDERDRFVFNIRHQADNGLYIRKNMNSPYLKIGELERERFLSTSKAENVVAVDTIEKKRNYGWPEWEQYSDKDSIDFFKQTARFFKFISPEIVAKVVENNKKHKNELIDLLESKGITSSIYMWDGSPCLFPGIRRFVGKGEEAHSFVDDNNRSEKQAIYFDDNRFPRHFWSYLMRGKKYDNNGPLGYSLAHILPHKDYQLDNVALELKLPQKYKPFMLSGLFSSAANTCYSSTAVMKPTDHNLIVKQILQKKLISMYQDKCEILPPGIAFHDFESPLDIKSIDWGSEILDEQYLNEFFKFRLEELRRLFQSS